MSNTMNFVDVYIYRTFPSYLGTWEFDRRVDGWWKKHLCLITCINFI